MKQSLLRIFAFGVVLASLPISATAALLNPGDTIAMPGTTAGAQPVLAGAVVNDDLQTQLLDVLGGGSIFAIGTSLQNRVVSSSTDGTLIFGPRIDTIFNNTSRNFLVDRMELTGFGGFAVDAAYRTDSLGDRGPTSASRSADGNVMAFDFGFPLIGGNLLLDPHESSYFLSLHTSATAFTLDGHISIFARHLSFPGETYRFDFDNIAVPTASAVPAPAMVWLIGSGLLSLVAVSRRKRAS